MDRSHTHQDMTTQESIEGSLRWDVTEHSFQSPSIATTTALVLVVVTAAWVLGSYYLSSLAMKRNVNRKSPQPPGSLGLPIVGETFQFVSHFSNNTLDSFWAAKRAKYGPIFKISLFGSPTVLLDPPAGNKFIFANEGKLVENSWPETIKVLLGPDSPSLKRSDDYAIARRHFAGFLDPDSVSRYLPRVEHIAQEHLADFWQPSSGSDPFPISTFKLLKKFTFKLMADFCLSLRDEAEIEQMGEWFRAYSRGFMQVPINLPGFAYHQARKARISMCKFIGEVITKRRAELEDGTGSPTQDILSCLLAEPDETGRLNSDGEVMDNILLFLFAGHDTSSAVLTLTIRFIAMYPEIRQRILEEVNAVAAHKNEGEGLSREDVREMNYTWQVVQETMRLVAPVLGAYREAVTDIEIDGYTVSKGWKLHWTNQTSHLNPKFFKDPTKFDPSRFQTMTDLVPYTYLPFGGGPRICPGSSFAKMEILVFLYHLVRKYTWTLVDPNEPIVRFDLMPTSAKGIPIMVTKL